MTILLVKSNIYADQFKYLVEVLFDYKFNFLCYSDLDNYYSTPMAKLNNKFFIKEEEKV